MKYTYLFIFFCFSFLSLQSMEITSYKLENIPFCIVTSDITKYLDLAETSKLLRTCKKFRSECKYIPSKDELPQVGISGFLFQNTEFCRCLSDVEHIAAFIHYSKTKNEKMIQYLMIHENDANKEQRIRLLERFYPGSDCYNIGMNIKTYQHKDRELTADIIFQLYRFKEYYLMHFLLKQIDINELLHKASADLAIDVFAYLLSFGADIKYIAQDGTTVLHNAVISCEDDARFISRLINGGVDVNHPDKNGRTALHFAAYYYGGYNACLETLIKNGADINSKDKHGKTPYDYALMQQHRDSYDIFVDNGAEFTWDFDLLPETGIIEF